MKNINEMPLRDFMQPRGGMAALRFMLETVGVKISSQSVHGFSQHAIPSKYAPAIYVIRDRFKIDLSPYLRQDKRTPPTSHLKACIYPLTSLKLEPFGFGLLASEMNRAHCKPALFPINPPKRFNHHSLRKVLTKKLSPELRAHFIFRCDVEKEIKADEAAQESGLLG